MKLPFIQRSFLIAVVITVLTGGICGAVDFIPLETFDTFPPTDWSVVDGGSTSDTWMQNSDTTTWGSEPVAIADSDDAGSGTTMDEQLITVEFDCSSATLVLLEFDQYFNVYSSGGDEKADIDVSTDGGTNWTNVYQLTQAGGDVGASDTPDHQQLDISAEAAGNATVSVRFHYYDAEWDFYWVLDNVWIYEPDAVCIDLTPEISNGIGTEFSSVDHLITATNCGTQNHTFDLTVSEYTWTTEILDMSYNPLSSVNLDAQESTQFIVQVYIAEAPGSDSANLTASHATAKDTEDTIIINTTGVYYINDFSADPTSEWTFTGGWEWGPATASSGCGGVYQDPDEDTSPTADDNIIGYSIGGCYANGMAQTEWLTSPGFDFTGVDFVTLGFNRALGCESSTYDHAYLEISNDGSSWTTLFENDASASEPWTLVEYDISDYAGNQANVQIRFGMGPSDGTVAYCGWNIDDFYFLGYSGGDVAGVVSDNMGPLENATVEVVDTGDSTSTNASGEYSITLPEGTYDILFSAAGHNSLLVEDVDIEPDTVTPLDVELTYPDIDVTPTALEKTLNINTSDTDTITLSNTGNGLLEFDISITDTTPTRDRQTSVLLVTPDVVGGGDISVLLGILDANADISYTLWDAGSGTPSVTDMQAYDVVMLGNDIKWDATGSSINKTTLSNNLADYIDAGGSVFVSGFIWSYDEWGLGGGRFLTEDYSPFEIATTDIWESTTLGTYDDTHPIMQGVTTAGDNFNHQDLALSTNGTWVASWVDDENYIAVAPNCVGMNQVLFHDADFTGDVDQIIYNSIFYLAGGGPSEWLTADPITGEVDPPPAPNTLDITVTYDANQVDMPGDYTADLTINSNDGDEDPWVVPVTMHVEAPYWFTIDPEEQDGMQEAGFTIDYTVTINNIGDTNDAYDLAEVSSVWPMTFPDGIVVNVNAGESSDFTVRIEVPGGSSPGDSDIGTFSVTSQGAPAMSMQGTVTTECMVSVGYIDGTVTYDGTTPLEGATVTVVGESLSDTTIANGTYYIDNVPVGSGYTVKCEAPGYITQEVTDVEVLFHETTTVNFNLLYGEIDVTPGSFNVNVPVGGNLDEIMTISNSGTGELTYNLSITPPATRDIGDWTDILPIGATKTQWPGSCFGAGKFFVVGGFTDTDTGDVYDGIQIYDTDTGTWSESSAAPTNVFCCVSEYYDGKVYVVGGYADDAFSATDMVQIYDVSTDSWSTGATMPTARGGNSGGIIDGIIYSLCGSSTGSFPDDNVAYSYDIATDTWTTMTAGPISTYGISLGDGCAYNDKIYVGGHFSSTYNQFYEFDPAGGGTWTTLASIPTAIGGMTWSLVPLETEEFILAVGGGNDWTPTGTTYKYDPVTDSWSNLNKPMTQSVLGGACAAGYGEIYFYGGTTGSGPVAPAPFMMNTFDFINWITIDPTSGAIPASDSDDITLSFDAVAAGGAGVYEAWLVVNSNDGDENPINVPLTMNVYEGNTPTPPPPTDTPTITPTSDIPTYTPTMTPTGDIPTNTPTPTVEIPTCTPTEPPVDTPTPTPVDTPECDTLGVELEMPSTMYAPDDICYLWAHICNTGNMDLVDTPTFVVLGIEGEYWFWPTWNTDLDYATLTYMPGLTTVEIISEFTWPQFSPGASNIMFFGAIMNPEITEILGVIGDWTFGWTP